MSASCIIVFVRNPELGKVKTRLAKTIGNEAALEVYKKLMHHTESVLRSLASDKVVYYSEVIHESDLWDCCIYIKKLQKGKDLGQRMANAFEESFKSGYKKVIIVGSDLLDLSAEIIQNAFNQLEHNDAVIGPAKDGGYYLLGLKSLHDNIFKDKNWGTENVFTETMKDFEGKKIEFLKPLNDIDYIEDLKPYKAFEYLFKD